MDKDEDNSPCLECGLCCDGTLFGHVPLEDGGALHQPCEHHAKGNCAIYPNRPGQCRAFRCKPLLQYDEGEIGKEDLQMLVELVREARQELLDDAPPGLTLKALRQSAAVLPPELRPQMGTFERLLDRLFRHEGPQSLDD